MREYRRLEAYRLARSLMAGIYSTTPADPSTDRLRHASLAAATHIRDGSSRASEEELRAELAAASIALGEMAALIPECRQTGSLDPRLAEVLLARRNEAAAALESLMGSGGAGSTPAG